MTRVGALHEHGTGISSKKTLLHGVPVETPISECVFVRSFIASGLTVSVCNYCSHIIAAKDDKSLNIAEHSHLCAEMWLQTSEGTDGTD